MKIEPVSYVAPVVVSKKEANAASSGRKLIIIDGETLLKEEILQSCSRNDVFIPAIAWKNFNLHYRTSKAGRKNMQHLMLRIKKEPCLSELTSMVLNSIDINFSIFMAEMSKRTEKEQKIFLNRIRQLAVGNIYIGKIQLPRAVYDSQDILFSDVEREVTNRVRKTNCYAGGVQVIKAAKHTASATRGKSKNNGYKNTHTSKKGCHIDYRV